MRGKFIDYTGKVVGELTIIKRLENKKSDPQWLCRCSCGRSKDFAICSSHILTHKSLCCGKCKKKINSEKLVKNLIGKTYGQLTVVKRGKDKIYPDGRKRTGWICTCSCGRCGKFNVIGEYLKSGSCICCKSCRYEKSSNSLRENLIDKKFGKLTVVKKGKSVRYSNSKTRSRLETQWVCKCSCGSPKLITVRSSNLKNGHTKSCGCLVESFIATELKQWCKKNFEFVDPEHKMFKNPDTNQWLRCDIYIGKPETVDGIYIEVHGDQHYRFFPRYHVTQEGFEKSKHRDKIKKMYARKNGTYIEIDLRKIRTVNQAIQKIKNVTNGVLS